MTKKKTELIKVKDDRGYFYRRINHSGFHGNNLWYDAKHVEFQNFKNNRANGIILGIGK